ncbi:MAG: NAD(P)/FAD-dependent oxidoreductase [Planctomycetales bacterium]|nr:NAD(P)/FAD-dependent oxidoreductase [Planctomycetales bacterium]
MADRPRVVILGCGFGGMGASHSLRDVAADVTLLDKNDYHTFQPLLYQVATATLEPETVGHSIRELVHDHSNFRFHQTTVTGVNLADRTVEVEDMPPIPYDYLIAALGARVNFFGVEGAQEHSFPLYTLKDAVQLKNHVLRAFEEADKNPDLTDHGALNIVIVGGGPTGVETAGALAELFSMDFVDDFPDLPVNEGRIILVDGAPAVLHAFNDDLRAYAKDALEQRGVELRLGQHVTSVGPESVTLQSGEQIKTRTVIWAGGLQASPLAKWLGIEPGRGGRVPVRADLSLDGHPEVFVVGDVAQAEDSETHEVLPQLGAVALQAGKSAGRNVLNCIEGKPTEPFHYRDKGFMATIGRGAAVAQMPFGVSLRGTMAWLAWGSVHLALLTGWESRMATVIDWFWDLFQREHGKRIHVEE